MRFAKRYSGQRLNLRATTNCRGKSAGKLEGYGAVFYNSNDPDTEFQLWQDAFEHIMPGAFDRAIVEDDVRSLFNHDANIILGRNIAGTLQLSVDRVGLRYEVALPDTQLAHGVETSIRRGDVSGSSFMFLPTKTVWREEYRDGRPIEIREIHDVQLFEVGPVVFPAYKASTTGVRYSDVAEARADYVGWHQRSGIQRRAEAVLRETAAYDALQVRRRASFVQRDSRPNDTEFRYTAIHEAGHAVAVLAEGGKVTECHIERGNHVYGQTRNLLDGSNRIGRIAVALAGGLAEAKARTGSFGISDRFASARDIANIDELKATNEERHMGRKRAINILTRYSSRHATIASDLLRLGVMTENDFRELDHAK